MARFGAAIALTPACAIAHQPIVDMVFGSFTSPNATRGLSRNAVAICVQKSANAAVGTAPEPTRLPR